MDRRPATFEDVRGLNKLNSFNPLGEKLFGFFHECIETKWSNDSDFHNSLYQESISLGDKLANSLKVFSKEELSKYESIGASAILSSVLIDKTKQEIFENNNPDVFFGGVDDPVKLGDMYYYASMIDQECMAVLLQEADEKSRSCLIEHFFVNNKQAGTEEARQVMHEFLSHYLQVILNYYRDYIHVSGDTHVYEEIKKIREFFSGKSVASLVQYLVLKLKETEKDFSFEDKDGPVSVLSPFHGGVDDVLELSMLYHYASKIDEYFIKKFLEQQKEGKRQRIDLINESIQDLMGVLGFGDDE